MKLSTCSNLYFPNKIFCIIIRRLLINVYLVLLSFMLRPIILPNLTNFVLLYFESFQELLYYQHILVTFTYHLLLFLGFHEYSLTTFSNAILKRIKDNTFPWPKLDTSLRSSLNYSLRHVFCL